MTITTNGQITGISALTTSQTAAYQGRYLINVAGTSLAVPLATLTGVTSGLFSVTGLPIQFPAGTLNSSGDCLHAMAMVRKRNANGTANVNIYLGINNSTADGVIASLSATNVDSQDVFPVGTMFVASTTNGLANLAAAWNSQGQNRFANVLLTPGSTMYLNVGISSANALDAFDLLAVRVWRENVIT